MNKQFLKIFFCILFTANAFGQIKFQYGPKIGLTESFVHFATNTDQNTNHPGLDMLGGIFLRAGKGKFEIQPEFFYQNVGGTIKTATVIRSNTYQYLTMPILLGYHPVEGLTIQAGPAYSWALNAGTSIGPDRTTDMGITTGVRIDMLDMFSLFSLNFRYTMGLQNISSQIDVRRVPVDYRNNIFEFSISYYFSDYYNFNRKHKKK